MNHFANHSTEQTSLACTNLTDNNYEFALLDLQVDVLDVENVVK